MVKTNHILFIVENNPVPHDIRVWNEALAVKEFGYNVTILCPRSIKSPKKFEIIDNIRIYRHYIPFEADGKFALLLEYLNAIFWEFILSIFIFMKRPFDFIHAANPPDHIFLIAAFFKIFKVKFIFDHHDLTPENYLAKFHRKDLFYKISLLMEKMTFRIADTVITTNESYQKIALTRGNKKIEEIFVVRNGPDLSRIPQVVPNNKWKSNFKYLVAYVGNIGSQENIDILLKIVEYLVNKKKFVSIKYTIIGTGPQLEKMIQLCISMKIDQYVTFTGYIPYKDFYEILATADLCINPELSNAFTDKSTMLKIMDYMTFGKPIVQFETTEGKVTAGEAGFYVKENNIAHFGDAIINLLDDPQNRKQMGEIGRKRIEEQLNWNVQKKSLKAAYQYLESKNHH
jgi:glycosyltransferase involved in cell wall biosynthesis